MLTVVSTIMRITNKYIWKSHRCIQKEPKEVTLALQNQDVSRMFVFGVSFLQSRDPSSNYQPSIRVQLVSKREKKHSQAFKVLNVSYFSNQFKQCCGRTSSPQQRLQLQYFVAHGGDGINLSGDKLHLSEDRWKHIQLSPGLTERFQISFGTEMLE